MPKNLRAVEPFKNIQYFINSNFFKLTLSLAIFSILIVSLFITTTPANALIAGACNCVIFRFDDIQDEWVNPEQIAVMNKFIEKNEKLSLGIIMNDIGNDQAVINKVQEGHQSGLFELTLHGWMHVDYTTLSLANQKSTLQQASTKMQTIWGRNSTIFILPYNHYNTNTLQAMQELGLKIISSEFEQELNLADVYQAIPNSDIKDSRGIYHLPQVVEFYHQDVDPATKNPISNIENSITTTINQYGYAIVTLHPQDFGDTNAPYTVRTSDITDLDTLITWIKNNGYTIKSFSDVTGVPLPPLVGSIPVTTARPSGGTYSTTQMVTLTANEPATIYYTTNGSTPTQSSSVYSSPISISTTTTLKFFAKDTDGNVESVKTQIYTIDPNPTFTIQYYSDSNLVTSLGDNPKLKAGTYYLKITSSKALSGAPTISINSEGTANDATNAPTTLVSGNNYRYPRVIANDASAIGTTLEDISITGTDTLANTATNVNPTNETTKAAYTDTVSPTFTIQYYSNSGLTTSLGDNPKLKAGTYYLKITSDEALSGAPTISINSEGTANDATNAPTTLVSGNNYRYPRVIANDASAIGTTLEDISITGTDTLANTATNVNPTNEVAKAAYTDTISPSLVLSTPENPTNDESFVVTAQFSEPVSGVANSDFAVTGGTKSNFVAVDGDTYTITVTKTANLITIDMASNTSIDTAGNANTAATQLTVTFDNIIPTVTISTLTNPTNINPIPMTATFSEPVTGFAEGDISVTGGTVTAASLTTLDNIIYNFTITPTGNGTILVNITANAATDGVNGNSAATQFSVGYDTTVPSVILSGPLNPTNITPIPITATFSEPVTGFAEGDISVTGGTVTAASLTTLDNIIYNFTITPTGNGTILVNIAANAATDGVNGNSAATQYSIGFDGTNPTVVLYTPENPTNDSSFTITAQFSEPVTGVTIDDFTVNGGTKGNFVSLDSDTYTIDVIPNTSSISINMASNTSYDLAGNSLIAATQLLVTFDNIQPGVTLSTPLNPTPRPTFTITAQFSEPVTGVTIDDFVVSNGVKSNFVALDADTYSIKVTKNTNSVTINMASSSSFDFTGNGNTAANLVVSFDPQANTSSLCFPPQLQSDNWIIQSSCMIIDDVVRTGNVEVQNNAVLTIENGASLNIDFATHFLKVHSGSGVLIKSGGKIN